MPDQHTVRVSWKKRINMGYQFLFNKCRKRFAAAGYSCDIAVDPQAAGNTGGCKIPHPVGVQYPYYNHLREKRITVYRGEQVDDAHHTGKIPITIEQVNNRVLLFRMQSVQGRWG